MVELKDMETLELKENILNLNSEQLYLVSIDSIYNFILEYTDLYKLENDNFLINNIDNTTEKERVLEIFNELKNIFFNIIVDNEFNLEESLKLRNEIYNNLELLSAYYSELKYLKDKLDIVILKDREDRIEISSNISSRARSIVNNIESEIKHLDTYTTEYMNFMATIVNILPFKLSKYKYYGLIKDNLMKNLLLYPEAYVVNIIDRYKKQFTPVLYRGYGVEYNDYFTEIEIFKNSLNEITEINKYEELRDEVEKYLDNMAYNIFNIRRIGILVNRIITIGLISSNTKENIDESIFESFKSNSPIDNIVLEDLIKENEESLLEVVESFKNYNLEYYDRVGDSNELDEHFNKTREMLIYHNDINFTDMKILQIKEEDELIKYEILEKIIDNFVDFLKRNVKDIDNIEGRIKMRTLLTTLIPPFNTTEEFIDYVKYSLDEKIINEKELNLLLISLNYIMNERMK